MEWKRELSLCWAFIASLATFAQDQVSKRLIFIGDAGEINHKQETIVPRAAELVIPGKTTVMFLGDNIYPRGMGLPGSKEEGETQEIIRSQFAPMRAAGAPVYFIPGNHDWDKMGKDGLAKIRAQGAFLESQQDSLLRLLPPNGCPDPQAIALSDSVAILTFDSEWWLFPHERISSDSECDCATEDQVMERLQELLYDQQGKTVFLAIHHPLKTYGIHGGYYSWKQHLFPLTELNPNLYVPLPGVGSLYPLLRRTAFLNPEDMPHPTYGELVRRVRELTDGYANIIHVAGHDHGLQFIQDGDFHQIVSGAGAKNSHAGKGKHSLFAYPAQGFVVVDYLTDRSSAVTYYTYADDAIETAFTHTIPFREEPDFIHEAEKVTGGRDSVRVQANPTYDEVSPFHRRLFGENYRKEWAAPTNVPVLRLSELHGGLSPIKRGGGMQTVSLRLQDPTGKQWVLRSVNKQAESLLPQELHRTVAHEVLDDANSAQHPFGALILPPLANALHVPHTHPVIGIVAPDTALGHYNELFANTLCLLEEREPLGDSDNTPKMLRNLNKDNDDEFKAKTFLRARMLDLLVGDWDRHEDQWRWRDVNKDLKGADRDYLGVPRDRDQALRKMEGVLPRMVSSPPMMPLIQGIDTNIRRVHYSLRKSGFLNAHPKSQFTLEEWEEEVKEAVESLTDSVLEEAVRQLPAESYALRGEQLLKILKARRDALPAEMGKHYRFINRIVDVRLSNKHEKVIVTEEKNRALWLTVRKINKAGEVKGKLMDKIYDPEITDEVRIYLGSGNDSVSIQKMTSPIRLRVIGGTGSKHYDVVSDNRNVRLYDRGESSSFAPESRGFRLKSAADSAHTAFVPVNLYNVLAPVFSVGYNADDGLLLGAGFRYTRQHGFRTVPFNHVQEFTVRGAVATGAIHLRYNGHWKNAVGRTDAVLRVQALIPHRQYFFGLGNASRYDRDTFGKRYYRTRFELYQVDPFLQWELNSTTRLEAGPSVRWYRFSAARNEGQYIAQPGVVHTYDSLVIDKPKGHAGVSLGLMKDTRNRLIHPSRGGYFEVKWNGYRGVSEHAKSFMQATAELALYAGFAGDAIVFSNRVGGALTVGHPAFYQSFFLGGNDNLRGFRQYRFAGNHGLFNNLEFRSRIVYIGNYVLPGELGSIVFYDIGKVWAPVRQSSGWHHGVGGGLYYLAVNALALQAAVGHSVEGWYPYLGLGFRF